MVFDQEAISHNVPKKDTSTLKIKQNKIILYWYVGILPPSRKNPPELSLKSKERC